MFHRMLSYGENETRPTTLLTKDVIKKHMPKYKRHDDLIVVQEQHWDDFKRAMPMPVVREENNPFSVDEDELASLVCQTIEKPICRRLVVEKYIRGGDFRSPRTELILGDHGAVSHTENQIQYNFDITKSLFPFANASERLRMAELDCSDDIVVDLFAGVGFFSLPLLIHAKAKHLYACEWNLHAVDALRKNLQINKVDKTRFTVIEGDNRTNRPTDLAQRVVLAILPGCLDWMQTAFECVDKSTGGVLHCHELVELKPDIGTKQNSLNSLEASSIDKLSTASHSLMNQSISSSSSSHSTIEKLNAPSGDEKLPSSDCDKDTNSPVLLEKPQSLMGVANFSQSETSNNSVVLETSSICSAHEDSISNEPLQLNSQEISVHEARAQKLIVCIQEDVEAHDLSIRLGHIQPVESYGPYMMYVVYDILIEPKNANGNNHRSITSGNVETQFGGMRKNSVIRIVDETANIAR